MGAMLCYAMPIGASTFLLRARLDAVDEASEGDELLVEGWERAARHLAQQSILILRYPVLSSAMIAVT